MPPSGSAGTCGQWGEHWLYLYITVLISDDLNLNLFKKILYKNAVFKLLSFEMHVLSRVLGDGHG